MAHIPMGDVQTLWDDTRERNWSALHQTLQHHKGRVDGISDTLVDMLLPVAQDLAGQHQAYPDSPAKLYEILNQEIHAKR